MTTLVLQNSTTEIKLIWLTPQLIFLCISYSTGWGQTSGVNPFPPNHLQWAQLPIQTSENCQNIYSGTIITEGEICAGDDKATVCNVSIVESFYYVK